MKLSRRVALSVAALGATAGMLATAGPAQAATATGWVGPAGTSHLSTSTINNAPLVASSRIYSTFGAVSAPGDLGVRARLFKSGVLCEAVDYRYNTVATADLSAATTQTCGSGSYNSHGFVAVWNASNFTYNEYVTFPSNPLNWTAPATARTTTTSDQPLKSGINAKGQTFGSGDTKEQADAPELVAVYASNGRLGYVKNSDLNGTLAKDPKAAATQERTSRSIQVYETDGVTQIGQFQIS